MATVMDNSVLEALLEQVRPLKGLGKVADYIPALATVSGCIYFLGPLYAARAEAAFLSGSQSATVREARVSFELAVERAHNRFAGELETWSTGWVGSLWYRHRSGDRVLGPRSERSASGLLYCDATPDRG